METADEYKKMANFLMFISEATRNLSTESVAKIFSAETLQRTAQCKSTKEFLDVINSLGLQELEGKSCRKDSDPVLDRFLQRGEVPQSEDVERKIEQLQRPEETFSDLSNDISDGAIAGAIAGAAAGAWGAGLVTIPVGGVGASVGAIAGALAGAIGGAVGGLINYLTP